MNNNNTFSPIHSANLGGHIATACETHPTSNMEAAYLLDVLTEGRIGLSTRLRMVLEAR